MQRSEKVKVIANHYVFQQFDDRSQGEVLEQMQEWSEKGWLSREFIDGCHAAIEAGQQVEISYDPAEPCYGYLAGTPEAFKALTASKGPWVIESGTACEVAPNDRA